MMIKMSALFEDNDDDDDQNNNDNEENNDYDIIFWVANVLYDTDTGALFLSNRRRIEGSGFALFKPSWSVSLIVHLVAAWTVIRNISLPLSLSLPLYIYNVCDPPGFLSRSEKGLNGDSNPDLCDAGAVLYQWSYQADWELVVMRVNYKPVDDGYRAF